MDIPKQNEKKTNRPNQQQTQKRHEIMDVSDYSFYSKVHFQHMLNMERKRTERSKKPFLLLLLDISGLIAYEHYIRTTNKIISVLSSALREVDIRGWYEKDRVIGVICTEMEAIDVNAIEGIIRKIYDRLSEQIDAEYFRKISISFHVYPETCQSKALHGPFNIALYPDLAYQDARKRISLFVKNLIDLMGSVCALLLFSPIFLLITAAIKLTSQGPVFFRQERMGLNGRIFFLLKFRSMHYDCDHANHQEYIAKYICKQKDAAVEPGVFKLTNDNRITPVGRFLRKTSLDELPQFINVLKGEMSLVGPRPPIPYECDLYDIWHRRRLLSCKPGITGLWQVTGRSRTTFDEMVRLDLKYISEWNLWLDLKILLKTPMAVFSGKGAM